MADAENAVRAVEPAAAREFIDGWMSAVNAHDIDTAVSLLHGDVLFESSSWPTPMRGHGAVREYWAATFAGFPDLQFESVGEPLLAAQEPRISWYWRGTATHRGRIEPQGLDATGRHVAFAGGSFVTLRDGKAERFTALFDIADVMRQLCVLPPSGSRGERMIMALAGLRARLGRRGG